MALCRDCRNQFDLSKRSNDPTIEFQGRLSLLTVFLADPWTYPFFAFLHHRTNNVAEIKGDRGVAAHIRKWRSKADGRSCSSEVKPHGPVAGLAPQLGPSPGLRRERTFEQCVSPSPEATAATGSCTPRKSQVTTIRLMRGMETRTTVLAWEEGASRVIDCSNLWVGGWKRTAAGWRVRRSAQ